MREVLFKNLVSVNSRKKDIFLKEVFEKNGVTAKTERRCFYFIKEITDWSDQSDLQKWIDGHSNTCAQNKRHFHIMKAHSDELGEDRLICKIAGTFYVVSGKKIYTIGFLQAFKVRLMKASLA